uniref:Phospholipid-transporting ATPase n=1 Tax=Chromera velia CCMP2878 TaxID=1169474 RepID=A0A0G4HX08_9ALVE|eukprot:Cvel_1468.t1-p1 / transcript=Cvel_1468.t1 / gene=Cvel_1468 / organism=Chromera_velia_CCMP2878 / gene_product=Probable phospholipid-transporting ATPase IIB, putative / transcript_product=Probable phospholipid-transporting ATPase IIB, putative / location=Cvel_scaffold51:114827-125885(-) / protein_length=1315 / sequence_SO=supercontig / SO=protein_coding / is_pseudo=false
MRSVGHIIGRSTKEVKYSELSDMQVKPSGSQARDQGRDNNHERVPGELEDAPLLNNRFGQNASTLSKMSTWLVTCFCGPQATFLARDVHLAGTTRPSRFVSNKARNQKYNLFTFLPVVLYEQFRFFFNLFYLLTALSQFIPVLSIGYISTYLAPLIFVLTVTLSKEAYDDFQRYLRDKELNGEEYTRMTPDGPEPIAAADIKVGHVIVINANQRVPADALMLRTTEASGSTFIRTDQLDGETDWKLRRPISCTQQMAQNATHGNPEHLVLLDAVCEVEAPRKDIYEFEGRFTVRNLPGSAVTHTTASSHHTSAVQREEEDLEGGQAGASSSSTAFDSLQQPLKSSGTPNGKIVPQGGGAGASNGGMRVRGSAGGARELVPLTSGAGGEKGEGSASITPSVGGGEAMHVEPLGLENTLWANTVVASGSAYAVVIYTGKETRSAMNASTSETNVGLFDIEVNHLAKILCVALLVISIILVLGKGLSRIWYVYLCRFILLLSAIIPISLRVNLDMAKTLYSVLMMKDDKIPETIVRTSTIPEELGRIDFLLTDKTGTLTQNEMIFKKIHMGVAQFGDDAVEDIKHTLRLGFMDVAGGAGGASRSGGAGISLGSGDSPPSYPSPSPSPAPVSRGSGGNSNSVREALVGGGLGLGGGGSPGYGPSPSEGGITGLNSGGATGMTSGGGAYKTAVRGALREALLGLAVCHNVTPVWDSGGGAGGASEAGTAGGLEPFGDEADETGAGTESALESAEKQPQFQAASPDEVALVKFAADVGLRLVDRDEGRIVLVDPLGRRLEYEILHCFPFSSETKRMGIIVKERASGGEERIVFYMKGAEAVMMERIKTRGASWLKEECDNFGRTGLRTLVIASRVLSARELADFDARYSEARASMTDRAGRMRRAIESLEGGLSLLALTGVEDRLQIDVGVTLERLRHANVRVWMLTGDKVETAICIAISARLKGPMHSFFVLAAQGHSTDASRVEALESFALAADQQVLIVDGTVLTTFLKGEHEQFFIATACRSPAVVCCRCSPTQKADVVRAIRRYTGRRTCAIGDGGNDVSMILAADVGVGIVGKEGKQASLAADFSVPQFAHLQRLLLWHGRNSYQRSAKLAQFVIHRGLIIAIIQVVFSAVFFFIALPIFQGMLSVGYATFFTSFPVFALVLDEELPERIVMQYPELYESLKRGRVMSTKSFCGWAWKSVYQGGVIMLVSLLLFESEFMNIVAISFSALVLSELLNVASEVTTWHTYMVAAEVASVLIYILSLFLLPGYFDVNFITTWPFLWKVLAIVAVSWGPVHLFKVIRRIVRPPQYSKLIE